MIWPTKKLDSLTKRRRPITYGVVKPGESPSNGVRFVRSGDLVDGKVKVDGLRTISNDVSTQYSRTKLSGGELLVGLVGNPGEVALVPASLSGGNIARQVALVDLDAGVDRRFIYYFFRSSTGRSQLFARTLGSVQKVINLRDLKTVDVPLPPVEIQRQISRLLGALDDKIELNRQTARTLEELAQRLFKSWFVDFDPVRAKMAGRQPAHTPPEIADLFPDRLVDSPLGPIPEGWRCGKLGEIVTLLDSKRVPLSKKQRADMPGSYPYYGAASCMDYVGDYLFDDVLVLMAEDGSVTDGKGRPTLQYVWGKCWVNNHAHVLKGCDPFSDEMIYLSLADKEITPFVTGAVQPKLNQRNLKSIPLVIPSSPICAKFSEIVNDMFKRIRQLHDECEVLTELRDRLLPKLISGEIRVPARTTEMEDAL